MYNIIGDKAEPAPKNTVQMSSSMGTTPVTVLPDSGADISTAGQGIIDILGHHPDSLTPSEISPRAVNGACMKPLGNSAGQYCDSLEGSVIINIGLV